MKLIKFLLFSFFMIVLCNASTAQLFTKPNAALNQALQKVIDDLPNHLQNIQGELLQKSGQSSTYESKVKIPGAITTTLTAYHSSVDKSKSLEATIFETDNFDEAKKKYNELINQLKVGNFILPGQTKSFKWKVNYDKPDETKNFSSSIFRTGSSLEEFKDLKLEISMNAYVTSYTISLFVYEKKEDDELVSQNLNDY